MNGGQQPTRGLWEAGGCWTLALQQGDRALIQATLSGQIQKQEVTCSNEATFLKLQLLKGKKSKDVCILKS